jgi:hypothetical protein
MEYICLSADILKKRNPKLCQLQKLHHILCQDIKFKSMNN